MVKLGIWDTKLPSFAECLPTALGKENPKKRKQALPSARCMHSAKHFLKKIKNTFLCRVPTRGTRQRGRHRDLAVTAAFFYRVPSWHSGNPLPSVRHAALGKEAFAVKGYVDSSLPSAALGKDTLGKAFVECNCTALGKARVCCSGSICAKRHN